MVLESLMQSSSGGQSRQQLGGQQEMASREMEQPARAGSDVALMAAAVSVILSWYEFYYRGNRTSGIFVGLWPPTILSFANYLRQRGLESEIRQNR
jgi:hypothetical protein